MTKPCIACGEPIQPNATICKECSSDQSRWRIELKYWAGVAGIITLVASGIAFTANLGSQLLRRWLGHEIAVANFDSFGKTVVWNLTGKPVYLKTIRVVSAAPKNDLVWDVYQSIRANSSIDIELAKVAERTWRPPQQGMFGKSAAAYAELEEGDFDRLKKNEMRDQYVPAFLSSDGETYAQVNRFLGAKFRSFPCTATIDYVALENSLASSQNVPCVGVFRQRSVVANQ